MPSVFLATTLHDSTGWTLQPLSETAKLLDECNDSRLTVVTSGTKPEVLEALRETGWIIVEPRSRVGVQYITDSQRRESSGLRWSGAQILPTWWTWTGLSTRPAATPKS